MDFIENIIMDNVEAFSKDTKFGDIRKAFHHMSDNSPIDPRCKRYHVGSLISNPRSSIDSQVQAFIFKEIGVIDVHPGGAYVVLSGSEFYPVHIVFPYGFGEDSSEQLDDKRIRVYYQDTDGLENVYVYNDGEEFAELRREKFVPNAIVDAILYFNAVLYYSGAIPNDRYYTNREFLDQYSETVHADPSIDIALLG